MLRHRSSLSLYEQVVKITDAYLGPASERFVARQVENHLQKRPIDLKKKDLKDLTQWLQLALSLLIDDREVVEKYVAELQRVS